MKLFSKDTDPVKIKPIYDMKVSIQEDCMFIRFIGEYGTSIELGEDSLWIDFIETEHDAITAESGAMNYPVIKETRMQGVISYKQFLVSKNIMLDGIGYRFDKLKILEALRQGKSTKVMPFGRFELSEKFFMKEPNMSDDDEIFYSYNLHNIANKIAEWLYIKD